MIIKTYDSKEDASKQAANLMIKDMLQSSQLVLGLATGSTPLCVYKNLVESYKKGLISFKHTRTFNLDEYIGIDRNHEQSYYSFMRKNLFDKVDINHKNIHMPNNDVNRLNQIADEYNTLLKENIVDLQILGVGTNGHIGFNEPGTPLRNETFIVELDEQTRNDNARFFDSIEEVPTHAITMGIKNIMKSRKIIILAFGEAKADAVRGMIEGPITKELPASVLQLHPNCVVILDKEAASKLSNPY